MVASGLLYYAALLGCYLYTIVPTNFSEGFTYHTLPEWCWLLSVLLAITPLLWMPCDFKRPSDYTSLFLYACVTVPCTFMPFLVSQREPESVVALPVMVVAAHALLDAVRRGRLIKVPRVANTKTLFMVVLPIVTVIISLALWSFVGFRINMGIENVYERRADAREALGGGFFAVILRYGESLALGAFLPAITVMGAVKKRPYMLATAALAVLAIFSFDGQKSVLFGPFMLVFVTILAMRVRRNTGLWLLGAFIGLCVIASAEVFLLDQNTVSIYIVRRVMVMPGQLADFYWEFFSTHPLVMMRDGPIGGIFSRSPYPLPTPMVIGSEYFANPDANANAGMWLAGFAHFGYIGVMLASVAAGILLRFVDSMAVTGRHVAGCAFCTMLGLIWANGALHTSLMSNGVLALLMLMFLFPPDPRGDPNSRETSPR